MLTNSNRNAKDRLFKCIVRFFITNIFIFIEYKNLMYDRRGARERAYHNVCENKDDKVLRIFLKVSKIIRRLCIEKQNI